MVWCRIQVAVDCPQLKNIVVEGSASKQDYGWTSSSSDLRLTAKHGENDHITLKPESGFLGIECGVGCYFTLKIYVLNKQYVGEIKGMVDIPTSGNDMFEITANTTNIPIKIEYNGKGGTGNAHQYKVRVSTLLSDGYRTGTFVKQDGGLQAFEKMVWNVGEFAVKAAITAGFA